MIFIESLFLWKRNRFDMFLTSFLALDTADKLKAIENSATSFHLSE